MRRIAVILILIVLISAGAASAADDDAGVFTLRQLSRDGALTDTAHADTTIAADAPPEAGIFAIGANAGGLLAGVGDIHVGYFIAARGEIMITKNLALSASVIYADVQLSYEEEPDNIPPPYQRAAAFHIIDAGMRFRSGKTFYLRAALGFLWYHLQEPAPYKIGPNRFAYSYFGETSPTLGAGFGWEAPSRPISPYIEFEWTYTIASVVPSWTTYARLGLSCHL